MTDSDIIDKLIKQAGGVSAFADAMGVSRQAIWEWKKELSASGRIRIFYYAEENKFTLPKGFLRRAIAA